MAIDELEKSLAEAPPDTDSRARLQRELGELYTRIGDHDQGLRHLVEARRLYEMTGNARERGRMDAVIGDACSYKGEHERALTYLERALDTADEIGDPDLRARTINLLAEQAMRRGDAARAEELWQHARRHFDQYWDGRELSRCCAGLAVLAAERHELEVADRLAAKAFEDAEQSGDPLWIGRAQLARAAVFWHADDHKQAKRQFRRAITLFQSHDFRRELAEAYLRYGLFFGDLNNRLGHGEHDPAAYWLAKAQALFRDLGGLADLERVREAFRRYGRRATDRVAEVEVLQLLQELKQSRLTVQRATEHISELVTNTFEQALDPERREQSSQEFIAAERSVSRSLDEMAMAEERFLGAVNAVVVERENIRSLIELARTLTTIEKYGELTTRIAEMACQLTTGDRGLLVLEGDDGEPLVSGSHGIDADAESDWRQPVLETAIERGQAELLFRASPDQPAADTQVDPRQKRQHQLRLGHAMVVALRQGQQVLGAIYVDKEITGGVFTERDLDLLVVFAGQAAAILENRRIQEELRIASRHKAATLNSVSDAVISIDADANITAINATASRIFAIRIAEVENPRLPSLHTVHEIEFLLGCLHRQEELDGRLVSLSAGEFLCNTRIVRDDKGAAVGLVATFTELKRATSLAQRMVGSTARYSFGDLIGQSPPLKRALVLGEAAARSDSSVLITGESGTGKEILAQAIHNGGARAAGPFVALNCAAIPRDLLESELFGYESGAFTGARKGGRPGKFELAEGGTILLDEIGDMPLEMQVKLLRVLQERTTQRLGGTRELPLNCRVIATTNRDLATEVARGLFRQDLFFRLRVIHIDLPPLRQRPEDIARLTEHFLEIYSARMGKQLESVSPMVMDVFKNYPWPGNVRELEHVLEGEVNLASEEARALTEVPVMIELNLRQAQSMVAPVPANQYPYPANPGIGPAPGYSPPPSAPNGAVVKTISDSERELLEAALVAHRGKIPEVARALGVSRGTIYNKMKKYKIDPDTYRA